MSKLCIILNMMPHYRKAIYEIIDREFDCDWYVGDGVDDIASMDYGHIKRCTVLRNKYFGFKAYYQKNMLGKIFDKRYSRYLMTGDIRNLSLWMFLIISRFYPKKKVYTWTHGYYGKGGRFTNFVNRLFFALSDGVFLYGEYARNFMIYQGISPSKLFVIHNSLDYDEHVKCRASISKTNIYEIHFNNSFPNLIFVGRLTQVKRLDLLIEAIEILSKEGRFYNVTFVGDGTERAQLEKLVSKYNLHDRIWFYGSCYDEKINAELIYNADLCVSPGNVGLTAIHSLVFGTPVATHDNFVEQMPEFEAIKDGYTGTFFRYHDSVSIACAIKKWFDEFKDERDIVRRRCMEEIDLRWNPKYQIEVLKQNIDVI